MKSHYIIAFVLTAVLLSGATNGYAKHYKIIRDSKGRAVKVIAVENTTAYILTHPVSSVYNRLWKPLVTTDGFGKAISQKDMESPDTTLKGTAQNTVQSASNVASHVPFVGTITKTFGKLMQGFSPSGVNSQSQSGK